MIQNDGKPINNNKVKSLYDALKADGGDVGSVQEFNDWFNADEQHRKEVYDVFKADGADVGKDFAEFAAWLHDTTVQAEALNKQPYMQRQQSPVVPTMEPAKNTKEQWEQTYGSVKKPEEKQQSSASRGAYPGDKGAFNDLLTDYSPEAVAEGQLGINRRMVRDEIDRAVPKVYEQEVRDTFIDAIIEEEAEELGSAAEQQQRRDDDYAAKKAANVVQVEELAKSIEQQRAAAVKRDEDAARQQEEGRGFWAKLGSAMMAQEQGNPSAANIVHYGRDVQEYNAAQRALTNAQRIIAEADHNAKEGKFESTFIAGLGRGFGQKFSDVSTWDLGITEMSDNIALFDALNAWEKQQQLTPSQQALLDAKVVELATTEFFGSKLGRGYKAGQVTAESIPFMVEMIANPLSTVGKGAVKTLAKYAMKRYGGKGIKNALMRTGIKALGYEARAIGAAAGMSLTTGAVGVAADATKRRTGRPTGSYDDEGKLHMTDIDYNDVESAGLAGWHAFLARTIENWSEMALPEGGIAIGKWLKKAAGTKAGSKIKLDAVTGFFDKVGASQAGTFITDLEKRAQWHGGIGEFMEEIYGGITNAIMVGDESIRGKDGLIWGTSDKDALFNQDNLIDTGLGVGVMSFVFPFMKTMGFAAEKGVLPKVEAYRYKHNAKKAMNAADEAAQRLFEDNKKEWDGIRNVLAYGTADEVKDAVKGVLSNNEYSKEQKQAVWDYAVKAQGYRGVETMADQMKEEILDNPVTATAINAMNVYENAYDNALQPSQRIFINMYYNDMAEQIRSTFGEETARRLEADPVGVKVELEESGLLNDDQRQMVADYVAARAAKDGVTDGIADHADAAAAKKREIWAQRRNKTGGYTQMTLKDSDGIKTQVWWRDGIVVVNEDGSTNTEASDDTIVVWDEKAGKPRMVEPKLLTVTTSYTESQVEASIEYDRRHILEQETAQMEGRIAPGTTFPIGNVEAEVIDVANGVITYQLPNGQQGVMPAEETQAMVDAGMAEQYKIMQEQWKAQREQRKKAKTFYHDGKEFTVQGKQQGAPQTGNQQQSNSQQPNTATGEQQVNIVDGVPQEYVPEMRMVIKDEKGERPVVVKRVGLSPMWHDGKYTYVETAGGRYVEIEDDGELRREHIDNLKGMVQRYVAPAVAEEPQGEPAATVEPEQNGEQPEGEATEVTPEVALFEQVKSEMGDDARANIENTYKIKEQRVAEKKKALDDAKAAVVKAEWGSKEKATAEGKRDAAQKAYDEAVADFELWKAVKHLKDQEILAEAEAKEAATRAEKERRRAETEAARKAAQERYEAEMARRRAEQEKAKAEAAAKAQAEQTEAEEIATYVESPEAPRIAEVMAQPRDKRIAKAMEIYGDYFDADFDYPRDAKELVSQSMPKEKISWEDIHGERGLQSELGSNFTRGVGRGADINGFPSYIAKAGEGISFGDAVTKIYNSGMNWPQGEDTPRFGDDEIRDALLDLFRDSRNEGEFRNYAMLNRLEQAERLLSQYEAEMQQAIMDEEIRQRTGLEPAEYDAWIAMMQQRAEVVRYMSEEEYNNFINEYYGEQQETNDEQPAGSGEESAGAVQGQESEPTATEGADTGGAGEGTVSPVAEDIAAAERLAEQALLGKNVFYDEWDAEDSPRGKVYHRNIVIDGEFYIEQYLEPNDNGDYSGSHFYVNGERYEDINSALTAINIAAAEAEVNTNPSEAQKEAGNYKMGHVTVDGYDITIENPKGSVRRGTDPNGKAWEQTMNNTYGYIRGTEGVDGDHIDVFLSDDPTQGNVYVVDQVNADGSFDEHKVMYGFNSIEEARQAYLSNYEEGWRGLGAITPVSKEEFKKWIESSHRKTKPFSEYKSVETLGDVQLGEGVNSTAQSEEQPSKKPTAADVEAGGAVVDKLRSMGITVSTDIKENRKMRKQAEQDNSKAGEMRKLMTPEGKEYGFTYRGSIYLDPRAIGAEHPLYVYAHLWCEAYRILKPEKWGKLIDTIKQDAEAWKVMQELRPNLTADSDIAEEIIVSFSGNNGAQRLKEELERLASTNPDYKSRWGNIYNNIVKAIQDFWKAIGDFLSIEYESPEQIYNQVLRDFAAGTNPRAKVEEYLKARDEAYMQAAESGDIAKATEILNEALSEEVGNGMTPFIAVGKYMEVRNLARKVKTRDPKVIQQVAEMMAPLIPDNAVLVPAPSHNGRATDILDLANAISKIKGVPVADVLESAPRASQFQTKKEGGLIESKDMGITMNGTLPEDRIPILIDNVIDSGNTAEACIKTLGKGIVATLGDSVDQYKHAVSLKSAAPILKGKDGKIVPLSKRFEIGGSKYIGRAVKGEESAADKGATTEQSGDYTITPTQYTTKRGNVIDVQLVKFNEQVSKEDFKNLAAIAREEKGWYSREDGGFMMRSAESAQKLADEYMKIREGEKKAEKKSEEKPTNEKKDVSLQSETESAKELELTAEIIDSLDIEDYIKTGAKAYLQGEKTPANQLLFLIAQDYVRSNDRHTERDSGDANREDLGGGEGTESAVRGDGQSGGRGGRLDREEGNGAVPTDGTGREDSEANVGAGDGERGNIGVGGDTSDNVGGDERGTKGSGTNRSNGGNGKRGGRKGSSRVSAKDGGRRGAAPTREQLKQDLDNAVDDFLTALKEDIDSPIQGKLMAVDPVTLYTALGARKAAKVMGAGVKVAVAAVRLGYQEFKAWSKVMRERLADALRQFASFNDSQIDDFIELMWDCSVEIDGETHKVSEWASILSDKQLRDAMKMTLEEKRKLQAEAEKVETIVGNIDNIRESLPFLLPKQQEDVEKAEKQFFDESHADKAHGNGKGYMFTNSTGTGKTYTGLGIVKRFVKQGKGRVLIVTAQEKKINDWIKDAKNLGIDATMLQDTKSKGAGVVVTQYANMRQNMALLEDEFDLIVYDESHKLLENQDGTSTVAAEQHHMLANRDVRQAVRRKIMTSDFGKQFTEAEEKLQMFAKMSELPTTKWTDEMKTAYREIGGTSQDIERSIAALRTLLNRKEEMIEKEIDDRLEDPKQREEAEAATKKTKVVFLSATPFNTPAAMDYAEGYIFSYTPNEEGVAKEMERRRSRDTFLMNNFASSHQRGKNGGVTRIDQSRISDPFAANEEEIKFSDMLQNELNTMSGRELDSEYDYSREFPAMDFPQARMFNDAIQSLNDGRFKQLKKYFDHLLDDYNTMTGYMEIFKAQMIVPRIQQYIDLGKKVTLFHRRKAANVDMFPPFQFAMEKARQAKDVPETVLQQFENTYSKLFDWEQTIDYAFPQDTLLRAFMTDKEKRDFENALDKWERENSNQLAKLNGELAKLQIIAALAEQNGEPDKKTRDRIREVQKAIDKIMNKRPKPKCATVAAFNGTETEKAKEEAVTAFNNDDSPLKVLVVQVASGKEGISLHDTTGKFPRVQMSIFLPQSPIEFIQTEGRIFRVGNKSNAIFEYPFLGLDIELSSFAQKINGRSETTENLALGSRGRGLRDSIARAALASRKLDPAKQQGIGGKELDSRKAQNADGFDTAMQNYDEWRSERTVESTDLPDPVGYMMAQWGRPEKGERVLVPHAGRGTIARYVPANNRLTALEKAMDKFARLSALVGGSGREVKGVDFDEYNNVNKADVVLINTTHGKEPGSLVNGTLDAKEVRKALTHLEDSGRLVAVVSEGSVQDVTGLAGLPQYVVVGTIKLPSFLVNGKAASVVIIDKVPNKELRANITRTDIDLSSAKDEQSFFAQMRQVAMPNRTIDAVGKIMKRLDTLASQFENTGLVATTKLGGKNVPRISLDRYSYRVYYKDGRGNMRFYIRESSYYTSGRNGLFYIDIDSIAKNDFKEIQTTAQRWVLNDKLANMTDEELARKYQVSITNPVLGSIRDCIRLQCKALEIALGKTPMQIRNIAEGRVENEVKGSYDLKQFVEVFNSLNVGNAELEDLAKKVFEAAEKVPNLQFRVAPREEFSSSNTVAHFAPSKNAIELNADQYNSVRISDDFKAQALVHETIHAMTTWALSTYKDENRRDQLTPEQQQACKDILDVYENIKDDEGFRSKLRLNSDISDNAEYGLNSAEEMIAEMANPVFRAALKAKKLWRQLVNGVKMLLGIKIPGTEAEESNALDVLDKALDTLLNTFNPNVYSAYAHTPFRTVHEMRMQKGGAELSAPTDAQRALVEALVEQLNGMGIPTHMAVGRGQEMLDKYRELARLLAVYHGSGADFERFDHSHMGEGEGAQSYGWGTYVTEVEDIGKVYAEGLGKNSVRYIGKEYMPLYLQKTVERMLSSGRKLDDIKQSIAKTRDMYNDDYKNYPEHEKEERTRRYNEAVKYLENVTDKDFVEDGGHYLYTVEIPDDNGSNYLEWDKPVSDEQLKRIEDGLLERGIPQDMVESIRKGLRYKQNRTGRYVYDRIADIILPTANNPKQASEFLHSIGFTGIKYPAQFRSGGREDNAKNYVIFDENDLKIVDKVRFHKAGDGDYMPAPTFYSNAEKAVEGIKQEKATAEQWLAMIQKAGGLKAGEDKWMGLSDFLSDNPKRTLTKGQLLGFIRMNEIEMEEYSYAENTDVEKETQEYIKETFGNGKSLEELQKEVDANAESMDRYDRLGEYPDPFQLDEYLMECMVQEYGDDFRRGYNIEDGEIVYDTQVLIDTDNYDEYNREIAGNDNRKIISIREEYTTDFLKNKREIAFVVPNVESWDEHDEVHFGDAGEGRAVMWVRFGETTDKDGKKVLVIDEIQSNRHQEGREKGYKRTLTVPELHVGEYEKLSHINSSAEVLDKEGINYGYITKIGDRYYYAIRSNGTQIGYYDTEQEALNAIKKDYAVVDGIPDAPFDKNWHEVAMKRMLRYAAENGYDKVAWTTGEQQAERYNMSKVVEKITTHPMQDYDRNHDVDIVREINLYEPGSGSPISLLVTEKGDVVGGDYFTGNNVRDIFGKDLAEKIMTSEGRSTFEGDNLRIGGEGMKGFYDQILPRYMDKYGKKWGVKTGEVFLPQVGDNGLTMHSVDVTPEMKASVMEGQPLFFKTEDGEVLGYTLNGEIYIDPRYAKADTPVHEYTHLWVDALEISNPTAFARLADEMKSVEDGKLWEYVRGRYPEIDSESELVKEVFAHYSGKRGRERLEAEMREEMAKSNGYVEKATIANMFHKLREILSKFWNMARDLFAGKVEGIENMTADDFADMALNDLLGGYDPREESKARDKEYMEAVEKGDVETEQKMVDEAAKKAGYNIDGYHGTTHMFNIFDRSKGNAGGNWGKGFYFTNNEDDAEANYSTSEGPDLNIRIELMAEQMEWQDGYEDMDYEQRKEEARKILDGGENRIISAALRMENPLVIGTHAEMPETFFDFDEKYNEETDEYEGEPTGLLVDFVEAWRDVMSEPEWEHNNIDPSEILSWGYGGFTASQLEKTARELLGSQMVTDTEGNLTTGEFLRQVFERMGFDGIIDSNVNFKFGTQRKVGRSMSGMDNGTIHYIAFTPNQIKQTDPVTYDDNGNVIPLSKRFNSESDDIRFQKANAEDITSEENIAHGLEALQQLADGAEEVRGAKVINNFETAKNNSQNTESEGGNDSNNLFRMVDEEETIERLEREPKETGFRNVVLNEDGTLGSPMASKLGKRGAKSKATSGFELGAWEQADENPAIATENGKINLIKPDGKTVGSVDYNPYIHIRPTLVNKQFKQAWERPNLVYVETQYPTSELTSGYKAEKAKKSVGRHNWNGGELILSRYDKPMRIVPWEEVADDWVKEFAGEGIHFDIIPPKLLPILVERGMEILPPHKGMGKNCKEAYKAWQEDPEAYYNNEREREGDEEATGMTFGDWFDGGSVERIAAFVGYTPQQVEDMKEHQKHSSRRRFADTIEKLGLTDKVTVVDSIDELEGADKFSERKRRAKGWYNNKTGKIVVVLSNHRNSDDVVKTILHEGVAHHGLRQLFGDHFTTFLDNVYAYADESIRKEIAALSKKYNWDVRTATEEYLARLAEDTDFENPEKQSWWTTIKELFWQMLHELGLKVGKFDSTLGDNELRYLLWRSYQNLVEPGRYRSFANIATDVAMQNTLQVGNFAPKGANTEQGEWQDMPMTAEPSEDDGIEFRDGDFSERDRVIARDAYERMVSSGAYQFREAMQDSMLSLAKAYKAILGGGKDFHIEDVAGNMNAYLAENRMSSTNAAEQHIYFQEYMKPVLDAIHALVGKDEKKRQELTDYMMAKHGLERNVKFAQRDALEAAKHGADFGLAFQTNRTRDYAGLTALTGEDSVVNAEGVAQKMVDDYEQTHDTKALWDAVNDANGVTLAKMYISGILSKEGYEQIRDMFDYYIPLRGFDEKTSDEVYGYLTSNEGPWRGGSIMKHAEGRSSKADDPIATMALMADQAIRQANRNEMKQKFLTFVQDNPSDLVSVSKLWLQYDAANDEWVPVFADIEATDSPADVERKVAAFEQRMEQLAAANPDMYKSGAEAANIPYRVLPENKREHQVLVKRGGETYVLTINGNPRAAQALNGLTNPDIEAGNVLKGVLRGVEWANRQLSAFYTTRNPDFVASNFLRDTVYSNAMVWVKESPKYATAFHKNWARLNPATMGVLFSKWEQGTLDDRNKMERLFKLFMLNGGETGYTNVKDLEGKKREIAKELKKRSNVASNAAALLGVQLDVINRAVENCARFAAFMTSQEMGRSVERSVYDAKEISVNFNKKGAGGKMVNTVGENIMGKAGSVISGGGRLLYVFWNAGMQGMTNFGRAFKRHPGKAATAAASLFALGYIISLANGGGDGDDDDKGAYYNLPEYVRRSNICINAGDVWVTIPLPIEYRAIYGLGELAAGVLTGHEHYTDLELAQQVTSQVSQILPLDFMEGGGGLHAFVPSTVKPIVEVNENKSWSGLPIYKDTFFNRNNPNWTKAYKNADKNIVAVTRWLNDLTNGDEYAADEKSGVIDLNPASIEYMLRGYFGGYFTFPNQLVKSTETVFGDREFDWRNVPVANRVIKEGDERTEARKLQSEYFDLLDEYEKTMSADKKKREKAESGLAGKADYEAWKSTNEAYKRAQVVDNFKPLLDALHEEKKYTSEYSTAEVTERENELRREMVNIINEMAAAEKEGKTYDYDSKVQEVLEREFDRHGYTSPAAGRRIASRMGGTDSYGGKDDLTKDYGKTYYNLRDSRDLEADVAIQQAISNETDKELASEIRKARNKVNKIKEDLGTSEVSFPKELWDDDEGEWVRMDTPEDVMSYYRWKRQVNVLDAYGISVQNQ